jgi:hypothetical protein
MKKDKRTEAIPIKLTKGEKKTIQEASLKDHDYPSSWVRKKILRLIDNEKQS